MMKCSPVFYVAFCMLVVFFSACEREEIVRTCSTYTGDEQNKTFYDPVLQVTVTSSLGFDLDQDGLDDLEFVAFDETEPSIYKACLVKGLNNGQLVEVSHGISPIDGGEVIDRESLMMDFEEKELEEPWQGSSGGPQSLAWYSLRGRGTPFAWNLWEDPGYLGVRIKRGSSIMHGWILLSITDYNQLNIHESGFCAP
jgi:hypothetical protein